MNRLGRRAKAYPFGVDELTRVLSYDPETGIMGTVPPFSTRGARMNSGHLYVAVPLLIDVTLRGNRKTEYLRADHLAWMLTTGRWPSGYMEHLNDLKADNRLDNLVHFDEDGVRWWYGRHPPDMERRMVTVKGNAQGPERRWEEYEGKALLLPVIEEASNGEA